MFLFNAFQILMSVLQVLVLMLELVWIMSMDISALVRLDMRVYTAKQVGRKEK